MATSQSDRKMLGIANKFKSLRRASEPLLQDILTSVPGIPRAPMITTTPRLEPPFPYLLRSNILPTESETYALRDVIVRTEAEESRLKEIASSYAKSGHFMISKTLVIQKLNCKIDCIHQFIVEHKAILSPIRRIPP